MECFNTYHFLNFFIVACAIGPSVNTLKAQLIFPSKLNFCNFFEILTTKSFKNQYIPQFSYENCDMNSIKFDLSNAFQRHQECLQIPNLFYFIFIERMVQ
jgi:hypothetical protein